MLIDQDEINALLNQANALADECDDTAAPPPPSTRVAAAALYKQLHDAPELARLVKLQVPFIVQLARRKMAVESVRRFSAGSIIEFERHVEEDLDLLVNNRPIGRGTAVKVGENFGVRVTAIDSQAKRIKSMGR